MFSKILEPNMRKLENIFRTGHNLNVKCEPSQLESISGVDPSIFCLGTMMLSLEHSVVDVL